MIDLPLVSLDLELLGAGADAEIIEVGAVKFRGEETLGTFSALVRPTRALSYRIGQLTGLQAEELASADPPGKVLDRLSTFIGAAPLVGQSIALDVEHLGQSGLRIKNPQLDTFELGTLLLSSLPAYDLRSIARALAIEPPTIHRALPDAILARDVFLALAERAARLSLPILGHVARLAAPLDWPLKLVFSEAQRTRVRELVQSSERRDLTLADDLLASVPLPKAREPLVSRDSSTSLDIEKLSGLLEARGAVAQALDGFEERAEQRQMLEAVAEAYNDGETLLVEAGTGTGKSLAYLLPSLYFAVVNRRRVVVSTNTINLQDQLRDKDLPDLLRATGLAARVSVLKGRGNYLCLRRWLSLLDARELSPAERMLLIKTLLWLPRTESGDRAELRLSAEEEEAWSRLAAVAESCSPSRCSFHREGTCFVARARRAAEDAHLLIVNHSLLLADLLAGRSVLPEYCHLVVDEAHHLENEATVQLGRRISEREVTRRLTELATKVGREWVGLLPDAVAALRQSASSATTEALAERLGQQGHEQIAGIRAGLQPLFQSLRAFLADHTRRGEGGPSAVRVTPASRAQPAWSQVDIVWADAGRDFLLLERTLAELVGKLEEGPRGDERLARAAAELADQLAFWDAARIHLNGVIAEGDPNTIAWLNVGLGDDLAINAAPLHVGTILRDELFAGLDSAVLTSATLTTQGSFRYVRERLGLDDARELIVGSPFDYAASTLIYLPTDAPEPGQVNYQRVVERVILDVAAELRGRTLVLFTSHSQLRATYGALRDRLDAQQVVPLGQGVGGSSRSRLLETFRSGAACVLMGTSSFWEGVDVVGDALSCLIMARLPFALPTDPIVEARSEQFDDPFSEYSLPQAVLRFRQGFGRLIRSRTDRGVMIVLDGRLRTRGYRAAFLRSLPACVFERGPAGDAGAVARAWIEATAPPGDEGMSDPPG
ncbi:MAG: DEAD/DEAH box helicase family protein [Chloroflexi bacterium]|nr:DEAD/DEAH box helicase family protein [Chloroflexota bacterium]